jgi:hypothetical protein
VLSCAVLRASFVDWLGSCSIQDPARFIPLSPLTTRRLLLLSGACTSSTVRRAICTSTEPALAARCSLPRPRRLQTSITQDYIRPSAANSPPDRSPHTALERVFCHVLGCTCRQLLPPHPSSFFFSSLVLFFFSSVPFWLRRLLTPLWLNSLRASTSCSRRLVTNHPPATRLFFFSSSLVSSSWPFRSPVLSFSPFGPTNLEQPATPSPTTPPSTRALQSLFQGSVERDACEISCYCCYCCYYLLLAPPSSSGSTTSAPRTQRNTHTGCTAAARRACLYVDGPSRRLLV